MFFWILAGLPYNACELEGFLKYVRNLKILNCLEIKKVANFQYSFFFKTVFFPPILSFCKVTELMGFEKLKT